jgi:dTDP-4-amino-4,6-dideoxygalactose transaminase
VSTARRPVTVPFLDVQAGYRELRHELDRAYERVMSSGHYILGAEVEGFEREFADVVGTRHAVGVGNGLDALAIALRARGIGAGDEVIVPAHTFIATWLAVGRCGASVVPVDVDAATLLIDPAAAAAAVTSRTAAIVPVHLYGNVVDMTPLHSLAARYGLTTLEDAAQAHGARAHDRAAGSLGDAAAFSFYPAKNLGAFGDAGAVTTDDPNIAERARRLRNYGSSERYLYAEAGDNSRLDPLQAAFLRVKLGALERWNRRRAAIADTYLEALAHVDDLTLPPVPARGVEPVWHLFCVRHPRRDQLMGHLAERGVATLVHYPEAPHRSQAFAHLGLEAGSFPVTECATATLLSLPIGPHLDDREVATVVDAVCAFEPAGR